MIGWLDGIFNRVFSGGTELELGAGVDYGSGLQATLNPTTKRIEVVATGTTTGTGGAPTARIRVLGAGIPNGGADDTHSGLGARDGEALAEGDLVEDVGHSNSTLRGYWVAHTIAWTRPTFYNDDAGVALLVGTFTTIEEGATGAGQAWRHVSGDTIAGGKYYERVLSYPLGEAVNGVYFAPEPTGDATIDTPALQALCAKLVANRGATLQLASRTNVDYHLNEDLILDLASGVTVRGGGGSYASGSRLVREGKSYQTRLSAGFNHPTYPATVVASVDALPLGSIAVGKYLEIGSRVFYKVTAVSGSGSITSLTLQPASAFQLAAGTPVVAGSRVRTNDALFQARTGVSVLVCGVSLVGNDPDFVGSGLNCDGGFFNGDCTKNRLEHFVSQTQGPWSVLPRLHASGPTPPADTLTGLCTHAIRLRIEYTDATHYRYSTNYHPDGGVDWQESGLDVAAGAHALQGTAAGLTYTPVNTAHSTSNVYEANIGMTTMTVIVGYNNQCGPGGLVAYSYEGMHATGVSNRALDLTGLAIGNELAWMNGSGVKVDITPQPGTTPGRGGLRLVNCWGGDIKVTGGDEMAAGPWVTVDGGGGMVLDTTCGISSSAVGAAGAVIRLNGVATVQIEGCYIFAPKVVDFVTATTLHCAIGAIQPPGGATSYTQLYAGAFIGQLDWQGYGQNAITAAYFRGIPQFSLGWNQATTTKALSNGNNVAVALSNQIITLSGWSALATIQTIQSSNIGEGSLLRLVWGAGLPTLVFAHEAAAGLATDRIKTLTGEDVRFTGAGHALLYHDVTAGRWILFDHSQPDTPNNLQTGTSYTAVLTDRAKVVDFNNAAAIAWTIPPASSVAYPPGTVLTACQLGAGQVTATPGAGVTINVEPGHTAQTAAQYTHLAVRLTDTANVWVAGGRVA